MALPLGSAAMRAFKAPRGIVVVGATNKQHKLGYAVLSNILSQGFDGKLFAVNHKVVVEPADILGVPAFSSTTQIPRDVCDLAVIVTPAASVPSIVESCGRQGIKSIIVISAGFGETGAEGKALESELVASARRGGVRILGPNTLGVIEPKAFNASFAVGTAQVGGIGFLSQSGAICTALLDMASGRGIGFSHFISLGNKCDLNETDFIEEWGHPSDESTVIAGYVEGISDGPHFMSIARQVTKKKPIILIKAGRTAAGKKAAASHTGSLTGSDRAFDAAFKQAGVIRAGTLQELLGLVSSFAHQPLPQNDAVAVVTNAGGPGIMAADAIEGAGLYLAQLGPGTISRLHKALPSAASTANPVDVLGDADASRYAIAVDAVLGDPVVGSVVVILTPQAPTQSLETAKLVVELGRKHNKTCIASFMGGDLVLDAIDVLQDGGPTPNFSEPEHAVLAIKAMVSQAKWVSTPAQALESMSGTDSDGARRVLQRIRDEGRLATGGFEARDVLALYGIPMPPSVVATTSGEAAKAAATMGFPVVLKIASPDILHKSGVGGVKLNLKTPEQVHDSFELMMHRAARHRPDATLMGCQVLPMIKEGGREIIVGLSKDDQWGTMIMFGLGGVLVEGIGDVSFRATPIDRREAWEMVEEIRSFDFFLKRGVDIEAIVDVLLRVSQLAADFPGITELDINPLVVREAGKGALCLDMRLALAP